MRLHISNLSFDVTDQDLWARFREYGCTEATVQLYPESRRSRGFGFVEVPIERAGAAIFDLDGAEHRGRKIKVSIATPRRRDA
jgi:RNA recognition motif-containing protein